MSPRLVTIGDNVVDCYPDLGWMYPGGNMVNVAVHATRLGLDAAYLGVLGDDHAGEAILHALRTEGVDTTAVRVAPGPNAWAEVRIVNGNREFGSGCEGVSRFSPSREHLSLLAAADLVHSGDCSMLEPHLAQIRQHAGWLSFDFSERPWAYVEQLAPLVDIAICSAPVPEPSGAESAAAVISLGYAVQRLGPSVVVITQGAQGATMFTDQVVHAPAGTGLIVDTLGAGDAFAARLLTGLLTGESPESLLPAATQYATECCADVGAFGHRTALPERTYSISTPSPVPAVSARPVPSNPPEES